MERHGGDRRTDHSAAAPPFPADGGPYHNGDRKEHCNDGNLPHQQQDHRHHHNFNDNADYGGFVKLYVVGIPRTASEMDVSAVFGEIGDIIEVVLLRDKRTGVKQECCFVKYATIEQAEKAMAVFNSQFTFPGATYPMKVKYADRERDRLGNIGAQTHKLYVGSVNRQAMRRDIEEIFSPFGVIEEIFIVKDEFKQNRGCVFVQYTFRDMALAAIQALNGIYVMRGCDQPLIVRFADPRKPRQGDTRNASYSNDPAHGYMPPNEMQQMKVLNLQPLHFGCSTETMASNDTAPVSSVYDSSNGIEHSIECDWSEHVSPDGDLYYYNCVTCESRWDMPDEYARYEQELDNLEQQRQVQESKLQTFSSPELSEVQKVAVLT